MITRESIKELHPIVINELARATDNGVYSAAERINAYRQLKRYTGRSQETLAVGMKLLNSLLYSGSTINVAAGADLLWEIFFDAPDAPKAPTPTFLSRAWPYLAFLGGVIGYLVFRLFVGAK